jgi:hypothetical protein
MLRHVGLTTDVGDEENSHGWLFSDASHWVLFYGERSELGEISTLVVNASLIIEHCLRVFSNGCN